MRINYILEARRSKEWQEGYDAAIAQIKERMQQSGSGAGGSSDLPSDFPSDPDDQRSGGGSGGSSSGSQDKNDSRGSGSQGVVRPEDCVGPEQLSNVPSTPGGFVDRKTGESIADSEGYEKEGGSDAQLEKEWADRAESVAKQYSSKGEGQQRFANKLMDIYKSKVDWKKELRKVVGRCISEEDKRRGYTNNNILISQDRIALSDKQKFDSLDYMLICLDTSGSFFGGEEMKQALTEVAQVALSKKPLRIFVVYWDTRIAGVDEFTSVRELTKSIKSGKLKIKGGGGTDPTCIWQMLKTDKRFKRMRPELTVIFTDGYLATTPKRDARRMQNLVWCIIDNPSWSAPPDALTRTIHLKMG